MMMVVGQEIRQFLRRQYAKGAPVFNEKAKRFWAGATALELGYGGITAVSRITALAPNTVRASIRDVQDPEVQASPRILWPGAGRKTIVQNDLTLVPALLALVVPGTQGGSRTTFALVVQEFAESSHRITHSRASRE